MKGRLFLLRKTCEITRYFLQLYLNNWADATSSPELLGCRPFLLAMRGTIDVILPDISKCLQNPVNTSWLWRISRRIWADQKRRIILNEIEDITWPRGDTKFLFECWKIFFQHEKRNFVSSGHVMFYLWYKHQWTVKGAISYVAIATVIFSHVKITCYFHMWRYQVFARKLTWYFIGVYILITILSVVLNFNQ